MSTVWAAPANGMRFYWAEEAVLVSLERRERIYYFSRGMDRSDA